METKRITSDWTIVSEVELVYKTKIKASDRPVIKSSKDAYDLLMQLWNHGTLDLQEEFKVLLLNRSNRVLGFYALSKGGITGTIVDLKLLFASALKAAAVGLIISHNHPSGQVKASRADEEITQKIAAGARILDIKLLDHIIIAAEGYFSFADEGLL